MERFCPLTFQSQLERRFRGSRYRRSQRHLGQGRLKVETGAAHNYRQVATRDRSVNLSVREFAVLGNTEFLIDRDAAEQPMIGAGALLGTGRPTDELEASIELHRIGGDQHAAGACACEPLGELDGNLALADRGRAKERNNASLASFELVRSTVHSRNGTYACDNAAVQIQGKTVLLTGATGGIGEAIAHELSRAGAKLIVSGRRADVLERIAADTGATIAVADLADREELEALVAAHSNVDILVANAALPASGELPDFSLDEIDRALDVNLRAPVIMSRLLVDQMVSRGSGQIVLIASLAGKVATAGSSLYSATKFGLRGFGAGLRADLVGSGVGVSVIFPGFVRDAGMFHESDVELPGYVGTSSPQDVAEAVRSAVENDRGEIDVAPLSVRAATKASELAPGLMGAVVRRLGSAEFTAEMADNQADKR